MKPLAGGPGASLSHRPRLAVDEREHGLPLGIHLYLASLIFIFDCFAWWAGRDPHSATPQPSRLCRWWTHRSIYLLPRVPRSPTASLGPRNTFTLRASRLVRLLLGAPFPVPSLSCFSLLYETVGTAAGTVLQGSCHWFVIGESAGLSFSIFDSPLVEFHPALPFFLGLAVLADASTAFAIVSHPNHIQIFYFTAQSALYAAPQGLFPSLTCANTSQLNPYRNASGPVVSHACSRRCHH